MLCFSGARTPVSLWYQGFGEVRFLRECTWKFDSGVHPDPLCRVFWCPMPMFWCQYLGRTVIQFLQIKIIINVLYKELASFIWSNLHCDVYVFLFVLLFVILFIHYILCLLWLYLYLLFVFGYISWHTSFIKHIFYKNSLAVS